jgi:hypothetical protein
VLRKIPDGRETLPEFTRPSPRHRGGNGKTLPGADRPTRRNGDPLPLDLREGDR